MEYREWDNIVAAYTQPRLTQDIDKLVAISGIAQVFQTKTADDYLAGLWKRSLPYQLLWRATDPGSENIGLQAGPGPQ